jgi:hypothetical protein
MVGVTLIRPWIKNKVRWVEQSVPCVCILRAPRCTFVMMSAVVARGEGPCAESL